MPQIKSQKKRVKTDKKRNLIASSQKSALRTSIKHTISAIKENDKEKATAAFNDVNSKLDKAVAKGLYHKNYANRKKSQLMRGLNAIN